MLGDALRDLFAERGRELVQDGQEFAAALNDWLGPEDAETGEINLLVDAVRFGAPQQLEQLVANGAAGFDAVIECARTLAHNRGGGAEASCAWAIASLGYGLGLISMPDASRFPRIASSRPIVPSAVPGESDQLNDTVLKHVPPTEVRPVVFEPQRTSRPAESDPARRRAVATIAVVGLASLLVGGLVAGVVLSGKDDPGSELAGHDPTSSSRHEPSASTVTAEATVTETRTESGGPTGLDPATHLHRGPLGDNELVVTSFTGTFSQLIVVDSNTGQSEPLTEGPNDELASISPDRTTITYLERTGADGRRPRVLDLATGESYDLLGTLGPCTYGNRPSFSPDGTRLALVCTDEGRTPTGLYVLTLAGDLVQQIDVEAKGLWGAPTWVSDDEIVFTRLGGEEDPENLWSVDLAGGAPELLTPGSTEHDSHPDYDPATGRLYFLHATGSNAYDLARQGGEIGQLWYLDDGRIESAGGPSEVSHPALSPDGMQVSFAIEQGGRWLLATAPVDDLDAVTVLDIPISEGAAAPAWGTR